MAEENASSVHSPDELTGVYRAFDYSSHNGLITSVLIGRTQDGAFIVLDESTDSIPKNEPLIRKLIKLESAVEWHALQDKLKYREKYIGCSHPTLDNL